SSAADEVRALVAKAKQWAEQLGKPVALWMSDKQDAFVKAVAAEFPGVPHRYCQNHFLRDVAKPVLEADSHAKVQMRKKVRGLRDIEKQVLQDRLEAAAAPASRDAPGTTTPAGQEPPAPGAAAASAAAAGLPADELGEVVLAYCAATRGLLNDDQGGPLHPPGLRMAEGLKEVRASLQRSLDAKKGGAPSSSCVGSPAASTVDSRPSPPSKS